MDGAPEKDRGRGRPTKWRKSFAAEAYDYCLKNHGSDQDLANHLGIGLRTLYTFLDKYPHFRQQVQEGRKRWRQNGCWNGVRSLYKMLDTQIVDVPKVRRKKKRMKDPKTGQYELVVVEQTEIMEKHILWPNLKAIVFLLLNQDPDTWKRNPEPVGESGPSPAETIRQALKELEQKHQPAATEG